MKLLRSMLCILVALSAGSLLAEESRGFFGWLSDVTYSAWKGATNTVKSIFGYGPESKKEEPKKTEPAAPAEMTAQKEEPKSAAQQSKP